MQNTILYLSVRTSSAAEDHRYNQTMNFQEALEHALDGDAVLFTGAGFSFGARNSTGEALRGAQSLAEYLASKVNLGGDTELQDAAEAYIDLRGKSELAKELLAEFRATDVAKYHRTVASVPWRRVYTTNYDTVFELASSLEGRSARAVTLSERPSDVKPTEFVAVHLNGYVERITETAGDEIRLTDSSYITSSIATSLWCGTLRQDLAIAKAVFFVGYSIADLDIARLLPNRSREERRTAAFRYYERIKDLSYCKRNPQFWLQYGIAALVFEDMERSERFFQTAYSIAHERDRYDTHKIDNHYARLLLQKAARSENKDAGILLFRRAREIVFRQIQSERLHYPYRVANGMGEFFDAFAPRFTVAEREEIRNAALFVKNRIEVSPPALQSHRKVRECLATMTRICLLLDSSGSRPPVAKTPR